MPYIHKENDPVVIDEATRQKMLGDLGAVDADRAKAKTKKGDYDVEQLPNFILTEVYSSEEPVLENQEQIESRIFMIGPYFCFLTRDKANINAPAVLKVFDSESKKENFDSDDNQLTLPPRGRVDWNSIKAGFSGKDYVSVEKSNARDEISAQFLPFPLGKIVCTYLSSKRASYQRFEELPANIKKNDVMAPMMYKMKNFKNSRTFVNDKYLVFIDSGYDLGGYDEKHEKAQPGTIIYFAYKVKDDAGNFLAPRNWEVFSVSNHRSDLPVDLSIELDYFKTDKNRGYKVLNDNYNLKTSIEEVAIYDRKIANGAPLFQDKIKNALGNVCLDAKEPNKIYYCSQNSPKGLNFVDMTGDKTQWKIGSRNFPKNYPEVNNLRLDPTGKFFIFDTGSEIVVLIKDTLQEVTTISDVKNYCLGDDGLVRGLDKENKMKIWRTNFEEMGKALDQQKVMRIVADEDIDNLFAPTVKKTTATVEAETFQHLDGTLKTYRTALEKSLKGAAKITEIPDLRKKVEAIGDSLKSKGFSADEANYIIKGLEEPLREKETELAQEYAGTVLAKITDRLSGSASIASMSEVRGLIDELSPISGLLDDDQRELVAGARKEMEVKMTDLFGRESEKIIAETEGVTEGVRRELSKCESLSEFNDWVENRLPHIKTKLRFLQNNCPLEAKEAFEAIMKVNREVTKLTDDYEQKFKAEYSAVREKASERIREFCDDLRGEIKKIIERLAAKGFKKRDQAEQYLSSSIARQQLEENITLFAKKDPDSAKTLGQELKVQIANALMAIERGSRVNVEAGGQQMVMFGEVPFPKFEEKVAKEKKPRRVELTWVANQLSAGAKVAKGEIMGDVCLSITETDGTRKNVRLYEGTDNEDEWRYGLMQVKGANPPPSYVSSEEFLEIKKLYRDWRKDDKSELKEEYDERREKMKALFAKIKKGGDGEDVEDLRNQYKEELEDLGKFEAEKHWSLLRRVDFINNNPPPEHTNGKGMVPEWQAHWVEDYDTEKYLEEIARAMQMQLDLQEGMLNLKGHAGTGKDVLIKMFCARANRPYFAMDCSKWTTEFELAEDVILEAKDGATQTVRVPSTILNGIQTEGAVVYFNEISAMTEQAQIFLHALLDEKRSLTLKTSSGKTIRAKKSVLLASSMNPSYPGTNDPQMATRSRLIEVDVNYASLHKDPEKNDPNKNPCISSSEALRMARGLSSLSNLTYDPDLKRNDFVKLWDKFVNAIDTGVPEPTPEQKFDLKVILSLVEFGEMMRTEFIKQIEGVMEDPVTGKETLPVTQPLTGREFRRCAYKLDKMDPKLKLPPADPEKVAKDLLKQIFLVHIYKSEDRKAVMTAMDADFTMELRKAA